jgi:hypothetical protein
MYSHQAERQPRSSLKHKVLKLAFETGLIRAGRGLWAKSLTVVNYHRIDDPYRNDFDSFKPNVSATPQDFDRQMKYLAKWFHVVSLEDVVKWLDNRGKPASLRSIDHVRRWLSRQLHIGFSDLKKI